MGLWSYRVRRGGLWSLGSGSGRRVVNASPLRPGIERGHVLGDRLRVVAEAALVEDAVVVGEEGHDAGVAVLRRVGDDGEPADEVAVDEVVGRAAGGLGALGGQQPVAVAVIRA